MGTTSKALSLLDYFTRARPLVGLSDLARLSGTNKATCFRLMSELVEHGLAEQLPATRDYRIGPAVLRLAILREAAVPMRDAAQPVLNHLATATGETAHLSHLVAGRLVTTGFAYGAASGMQVMMEDADVLPFHATSSGIAVLAHLAPDRQADILSAPLGEVTAETLRDPSAVRAKMAHVLTDGWSFTSNTFEAGVASVAMPLFDAHGAVQGAMAVAAPALRMTEVAQAYILQRLVLAAGDVMALWGGHAPPDVSAHWRKLTNERTPT